MKPRHLLLVIAVFSLGCNADSSRLQQTDAADKSDPVAQLTPVSLMLNWYPEAEHGGYYAALVHGYFEKEGLDVTVIPGGPSAPVVQQVARGEIEFGITNADRIVIARAQDAKLKALFAPLQNSPRCLLVHEESGIESFDQLKDVTMMLRQENAWAQFLIKKLPLEGVTIVPNSASLAPFLADPRAAKQGYIISEPFVAKSEGAKVRSLQVADLGFNPYTSVLMTSDASLAAHPKLAQQMIKAVERGWQHYLETPEETNRHIHKLNPEMSLEILAYGVEAIKEHCLASSSAEPLGRMTHDRWKTLVGQLEDLEMIEAATVDAATLFLPQQP
jgi:NitT/TauT family transport system substrate-binding protein